MTEEKIYLPVEDIKVNLRIAVWLHVTDMHNIGMTKKQIKQKIVRDVEFYIKDCLNFK